MVELISPIEASRKYRVDRRLVDFQIKQAKLKVRQKLPYGRGYVFYYDIDEVDAVMQAYLVRTGKEKVEAAPAPAPAVDLTPIVDQMETMATVLVDISSQMSAQNKALLAHFDLRIDQLAEAIAKLQVAPLPVPATVVEAKPEPVVVQPDSIQAAPAPQPAVRKHVAVVGLIPTQRNVIEKEFKDCFKLTFYESNNAKGRAFVNHIRSCDHVFFMTNFINHSSDDAIKNTHVDFTRVSGGVSSLRQKLTEYFCEKA